MKNCSFMQLYSAVVLTIMGLIPFMALGQLGANLSSTDNTNCQGAPCGYNGPSILINEIMLSPMTFDGSIYGGSVTQRGEWIELYNPNICEPVDISCFYLGNNANDTLPYSGGYVIPPGTVVPPAGFALIRGENAAPVPPNLLVSNGGLVVELVVDSTSVCIGGGSRLWFPNVGGWFAFYDNNGVPQDAVSWASQANTDQAPCVPAMAGCGYSGALSTYDDFPPTRRNYILNTNAADFQGESIRRMPNGAAWSGTGVPTYGFNNVPPPNPPIVICNGTAIAEPIGGNPPYTYLWDDPRAQTNQIADSLCAGVYCVIITDASNNTFQQCVTVEDFLAQTLISDGLCPGGTYTFPDSSVATGPGVYSIGLQTDLGCDSVVTYNLGLFPSYNYVIDKQICENHTYILPDGSEVGVTGTYNFAYQNIFGCDSNYTVNLVVTNPIHMYVDTLFCEGTQYELPDGTLTSNAGFYDILVPGDPTSCDTLFEVTLGYYPDFQINIEEQNNITCYGQNDGLISLSVSGTTGPYEYFWSDGIDHDSIADGLDEGDYIISVSDTIGCQQEITVNISEPPAIDLSLSADTLICLGAESQILAQANGGTGSFVYHWSTSNADSAMISVNPAIESIYSVYVEDDNGCLSESAQIEIDVISMDNGLLSVASDATICPEDSATILATYSGNYGPYDYSWTEGLEAGPGPYQVSPDEPTTYILTVSDICGNTLTDSILVNLFDTPVAIAPNLLIAGCGPLEVELFDSINTASNYNHEWVLTDGSTYFGNPVNFILNESSIYEVTLVVTSPDGCSATSENTAPIEVYEAPVASFNASTWSANSNESEIIFSDNSNGSVFNTWNIDNSVFENETEISYAFPDTGLYPIQLIVENEFGCLDTLTQWVTITVGHVVDVPNAFTPEGGSGDDPYYDPTSTTNTIFYPFMEYAEEYRLSIFNRWGELIFESKDQEMGWNGTYRDKPCPQDVYVYKIEVKYVDGKKVSKVGDVTLLR